MNLLWHSVFAITDRSFTRFDYIEESFSYKEGQFEMFSLPVKTSCPCAEKVNETPVGDGK